MYRKTKKKSNRPDVYQLVTDRIIEALEAGTVPWLKPWSCEGPARNLASKRPYRGLNAFLLQCSPYECPWWATFRQIEAKGGTVRKGEKSTLVVYWGRYMKREDADGAAATPMPAAEGDEDGDGRKPIWFLKYYRVFNLEQVDGITWERADVRESPFDPIEEAEAIVEAMPQRPPISHGGDRACYSPMLDEVRMPRHERFAEPEAYYSTLFHELVHSTGHSSRLNRPEVTGPKGFGTESYSREELVAEMGAAFLANMAGIDPKTEERSAAYIANWLIALRNDKKLVVSAATHAQRAADWILGPDEIEAAEEDGDTAEDLAPAAEAEAKAG